jgi:S1-C subfamily serine protease
MVDKEIEDYIKVQHSLGVSEKDIRNSLLSAGHAEEDFRHIIAKHTRRHAKKEFSLTTKHLFGLNVAVIVVFGLFFVYLAYDYNTKLDNLALEQEERVNEVDRRVTAQGDELKEQIGSVSSSLSSEVNLAKASIENVDSDLRSSMQDYYYQSLSRDSALSDSIQRMGNRSLTELSVFEEQLEIVKETTVDFSPIIPKAIKAVVTIGNKGPGYFTTAGSGVFINDKGYIVTNYHVIDELGSITIKTHDDKEYTATLVGKNEMWDIAVIKAVTEEDGFEYLDWADSGNVFVGEHIIAVGNPVGFDSTVTEGIISNTNRIIAGEQDIYYFQTDVAINSGNSGGPLIDKDGDIVGIATLKYSATGFEGLSFALRSNDVRSVVLNILEEETS